MRRSIDIASKIVAILGRMLSGGHVAADRTPKRPNWWKIAFVVALVAFEFAGEEAVALANEPTTGNLFDVQVMNGLVTAEGQGFRSDSGSPLLPNATAIQSVMETKVCIEGLHYFLGPDWVRVDQPYDEAVFTDTSGRF